MGTKYKLFPDGRVTYESVDEGKTWTGDGFYFTIHSGDAEGTAYYGCERLPDKPSR